MSYPPTKSTFVQLFIINLNSVMRKFIYISTLSAISFTSMAQHAVIKGVIKSDMDNYTIPSVSINLDGTVYKTSDLKGAFYLDNISMGEHKLVFTFLGYEKKEITVNIAGEKEVFDLQDLKLKQ